LGFIKRQADDFSNDLNSAYLIGLDQPLNGYIDDGGDINCFKIKLFAGRTDKITMQSLNSFVDSCVNFYDPQQTFIMYRELYQGKSAQITYTATQTGYYYIEDFGYPPKYGPYLLAATDINSCSPTCTSSYFDP